MVNKHVRVNQSRLVEIAIPATWNLAINILLIGKTKKQAAIVEISNRLILFVAFCKIVAAENKI